MSPGTSPTMEFERNARVVLEHGIERIDGHTRSRLNQARQRALEAAAGGRQRPWWRSSALMPAGAVAAASLLAVMLWYHEPAVRQGPLPEGHVTAVEDMDLLADAEGLDLIEGWDGPFYEWAADQSDANPQSDG